MNLTELKLIFSAIVFFCGAFGVLMPWAPRRGAAGERFVAWGDTFAGGVLAGAALLHLLNAGADWRRQLPGARSEHQVSAGIRFGRSGLPAYSSD
jgi:hypothetical protein